MSGELKLVQHVDLQRPEAAAKRDLLLGRDALFAKHQHVVIEVRSMNTREVVGGERPVQIEAEHFGADGAVEGTNLDGLQSGDSRHVAYGKVRGYSGVGSNRHMKLFVETRRKSGYWSNRLNLPARTFKGNQANPIRLSAAVINPMPNWK
jgi:hypothetical protein